MPKPLGIFRTYKEEILEHAKKNMPYSHIADVLIAKYNLTTSREILRQEISRGIRRSENSITKPENVEQGREVQAEKPMQTTSSHYFNSLKEELGLHENSFNLPEPFDDSVKTIRLPIGCDNILFLSDTQFPFHDNASITAALKYGIEQKVNTIFLNGDIVDFYSISDYEKDKRLRNLVAEIEMTREFLGILKQLFPNAQIYYRDGNHEERWMRYIRNNAKEFEGLQELEFAAMFHLDKLGIHHLTKRTIIEIGSLVSLHGHEIRGVGGVFPARTLFMKTLTSAICGDCHRTSEYSGKSINDKFHTCFTVGCLSVLRPNYSAGAQYNHGFAHITTKSNGDFKVKNFRILNGEIL
jgi:predicted phosphodiesterase